MKRKQLSLGFDSEPVKKPARVNPMRKLEFEINHNNKLLCQYFLHLLHKNFKVQKDEIFEVRLKGLHFCYAKAIDYKLIDLTEVVLNDLTYLSEGTIPLEWIKARYGSKYSMDEPIMRVVFERVIQTDLFTQISPDGVSQISES